MSPVQFACAKCQKVLRITKPELVGKKIRCPGCKSVLQVPTTSQKSMPKPREAEPDTPTREKVKKPAKPKRRSLVIPLVAVFLVVVAIGAGVAYSLGYLDLLGWDKPNTSPTHSQRVNNDRTPSGMPGTPTLRPTPTKPVKRLFERPGEANLALPLWTEQEEVTHREQLQKQIEAQQPVERELVEAWMNTPMAKTGLDGEILQLEGEMDVERIALAPNTLHVAAVEREKDHHVVRLWNLRTTEWEHVLTGHKDYLKDLVFSPDSKTLATAYSSGAVLLWDVESGKLKRTLEGPAGEVTGLAISPDGQWLACGGKIDYADFMGPQSSLFVWNLQTGELHPSFPPVATEVLCLAFHPNGKTLIVVEEENLKPKLHFIDLATGNLYQHSVEEKDLVKFLVSPTGTGLILVYKTDSVFGKRLVWYNLRTQQVSPILQEKMVSDNMDVSPMRDYLVVNTGLKIGIWQFAKDNSTEQIDLGSASGFSPVFSSGDTLLAASSGKHIQFWLMKDFFDNPDRDYAKFAKITHRGRFFRADVYDSTSDEDLVELAKLPRLISLQLGYEGQISDAGLAQLAKIPDLEKLSIFNPNITDAGLAHLSTLKNLNELTLRYQEKITDAGLRHLQGLTGLRSLELMDNELQGDGLQHLAALTKLEELALTTTSLTDNNLVHLKPFVQLKELKLNETPIGDSGVTHLVGFDKLTYLNVRDTQLTDEGLKSIGKLRQLTTLLLPVGISDAGFAHLQSLTNLEYVSIPTNPNFTGAGLVHLKDMTKMIELRLFKKPHLTKDGLASLPKLTHVRYLSLPEKETDTYMEYVKQMPNLQTLQLARSDLTDAGLQQLAGHPGLESLHLEGTKVTDAGLKYLEGLPKIRAIKIGDTAVTPDGVKNLRTVLSNKKVYVGR